MSSSSAGILVFEREHDDAAVDWADVLRMYQRTFSSGSAAFGFVDDWRIDGSVFQRRGVIVSLCVDLTKPMVSPSKLAVSPRFVRDAVDLVQLLLAVKPSVIRSILQRPANRRDPVDTSKYQDELRAMARGVPVELRLQFLVESTEMQHLKPRLLEYFMPKDNGKVSSFGSALKHRQELLAQLFLRPAALKRFAHLTSSSPIRAEFIIDTLKAKQAGNLDGEAFIRDLHEFLVALDAYKRERATQKCKIVTTYAPFQVEKVVLRLRPMSITPQNVPLAQALVVVGIPVDVARLNLDFRVILAGENDLKAFVRTICLGATALVLDMGRSTSEIGSAVDYDHQDIRTPLRSIFKAIASIRNLHGINISGVLQVCVRPHNRQAVWRGLFENVFGARTNPLEVLTIHEKSELREEDGMCIRLYGDRFRRENPDRRLLVRSLELHVEDSSGGEAVGDLARGFGDAEHVQMRFEDVDRSLAHQELVEILRFPSLRSLKLINATILTLDLFDPTILDAALPTKPALHELELRGIWLEDTASLRRFLEHLKPTPTGPSPLVGSLRRLCVLQENVDLDDAPLFDRGTLAVLDDMLFANPTLSDIVFSIDFSESNAPATRQQFLSKHNGRVLLVKGDAVTKTRNVAFLSTIGADATTPSARGQLDATLVSQIFAFCAPIKTRKIEIETLNQLQTFRDTVWGRSLALFVE